MANFSGYNGPPFPPYYPQQPPPGTNQDPYSHHNYTNSAPNPPQNQAPYQGIPGMEISTPVLDANQLAYFWNQVHSGNPMLPPNVLPPPQPSPMPQYPSFQQPASPQVQYPPAQSSRAQAANVQYHRVSEIGRSDREEGELSEESEVSTPDSRGSWKNGRRGSNNRKNESRGKVHHGSAQTTPSQQRISLAPRKDNASVSMPKSHPKQAKKMPPPPRSEPVQPKAPTNISHSRASELHKDAMDAVNGFHTHGIGYSSLAQESIFDLLDKELLRQLFKEAGIPLDEPSDTSKSSASASVQSTTQDPRTSSSQPKSSSGSGVSLLLSGAGVSLDPQTLANLNKTIGTPAPLSSQSAKIQSALSNQKAVPAIPGLNSGVQVSQSLSTPTDSSHHGGPAKQVKVVPEQKTAGQIDQATAREAYLAKLTAARNKNKKSVGLPATIPVTSDAVSIAPQQPPQVPLAIASVPAVGMQSRTPANASLQQQPSTASLPNAPGSTPSRPMVKMDVLARKLAAEREAKAMQSAQEAKLAAQASAHRQLLPASRSDSVSSIEYTQSRDSGASESAGEETGEPLDEWTQSESATPTTEPQTTAAPNGHPAIPGLFLAQDNPQVHHSQTSSTWKAQPPRHALPPRPEPSNSFQAQLTHALPPRPEPPASFQSPNHPIQTNYANSWQQENSRKRPASAASGAPSFAPAKRQQYGWHQMRSVDEHVVIDISSSEDEDDEGSDMEIDNEFEELVPSRPHVTSRQVAVNNLPAQQAFAPRNFQQGYSAPNSSFATPAAVSTPDPMGTAQAGDLQRRQVELAEKTKQLQEELKQKRLLKKSKIASGQQTPVPRQIESSVPASTLTLETTDSLTQLGSNLSSLGKPKTNQSLLRSESKEATPSVVRLPSSPTVSSSQPPIGRSVRTRAELNTLEADIASDQASLEQLQRQMEQMQEAIRRKNAMKEAVAQELENVGVDTEGMSLETMQAVKEDIAQATLEEAADEPEETENTTFLPVETSSHLDTPMIEERDSDEEEGQISDSIAGAEASSAAPVESAEDKMAQQKQEKEENEFERQITEMDTNIVAEGERQATSEPAREYASELSTADQLLASASALLEGSGAPNETDLNSEGISGDDDGEIESSGDGDAINDEMDVSSDSSSDSDAMEDYEPEALAPPPVNLEEDTDDSKMSTSSGSFEDSQSDDNDDNDAEDGDDAGVPLHEQPLQHETAESSGKSFDDSESSEEENLYEPFAEAPVEIATNDAASDDYDPLANEPDPNEQLKETVAQVADVNLESSEEGEISEHGSPIAPAAEATVDDDDDYEPEALPIPAPIQASSQDVGDDYEPSIPDPTIMEECEISSEDDELYEPEFPGSAVVEETNIQDLVVGELADVGQQPTASDIPAQHPAPIEDEDEDDYEPPSLPLVAATGETLSEDEDDDLYEPFPNDSALNGEKEPPTAMDNTEIDAPSYSAEDDDPMTDLFDDGTAHQSFADFAEPNHEHAVDAPNTNGSSNPLPSLTINNEPNLPSKASATMTSPILNVDGAASPYSSNVSVVTADNIAPELQPVVDVNNSAVSANLTLPPVNFVPYRSPLKMFKAFRYHSQFRDEVPGGYKSLTYSNTIDPQQPLCPLEMSGALCDDPTCIGQHMRDMGLPDDKILVQLGTLNPGKTEDDKTRWAAGLRTLITDLRSKGVKDTEVVAAEIAEYRRQFFNDPTRILDI